MKQFGKRGSTFATVVAAAVVLAVATTGGAVAGGLVTSKQIKNNTIKSKDVRDNNLKGVDIRDGSLSGADILDGSIGAADLGTGAVTAAQLGTIVKRTNSVVLADGTGNSVSISCAAGERLISGGTNTAGVGTSAGWSIIRTNASGNTWSATARNETGGNGTLIAEAYCLQ